MNLDLIQMLVSQLGVNEQQAKGGAGLLFKIAQDKLSSQDFSKMSSTLPEVSECMRSAPAESGGLMGMLGKAVGGKAGDLASLAAGFSKLGLDPAMIQQFLPVVLSFVQQKGGAEIVGMLQKVLKG